MPRTWTIITPENIPLELELANPLERAAALLLDTLIAALFNFLLALALTPLTGAARFRELFDGELDVTGRFLLLFFFAMPLTVVAYHTLLEGLRGGQTWGKQVLRLRVIRTDGTVPDLAAALIRNALRLVDYLPCTCGIGVISMLLSAQFRRLGDYAAGTLVVREGRTVAPTAVAEEPTLTTELQLLTPLAVANIGRLSQEQVLALRYFLLRASQLTPELREQTARQLAKEIAMLLWDGEPPENLPAERLLEEVVWLYRQRFGQGA